MRRLARPLYLLISVQAICLAIGFWFQYQLVLSTTEREASESAWLELATQSEPLIAGIKNLTDSRLNWTSFSSVIPQASLDDDPSQPAFILTDASGLILGFTKAASLGKWRHGERVQWKTDREVSATEGPRYGRLATISGERNAVLFPINGRDKQVIVYATMPTSPTWKKSLQSSFALASGLGFFWTLSLSAVAICILTTRFNFNATQRKAELDHDALRNAQDLLRTRDAVIFGLAKLAESRDPETGHHLERISLYTTRLATALRPFPKYQRIVTPTFVRLLGISSVLHDIGKVGVEDTVLLKPGKLTDAEHLRMQQHTVVAGDCLREIEERLGASNFLQTAREIALHHHERWDGKGYPYGLSGEAIPLAARIVAIADVYDALRSKRVYKEAYEHDQCVEAIRCGAGTQFDPELVEVFLEIESEFEAISRRFNPTAGEPSNRNMVEEVAADMRTSSHVDANSIKSITANQQAGEGSSAIEFVA
jgi:HD-GYP domain-containing protein (c-di-GMP phosphodiesterase class II)